MTKMREAWLQWGKENGAPPRAHTVRPYCGEMVSRERANTGMPWVLGLLQGLSTELRAR